VALDAFESGTFASLTLVALRSSGLSCTFALPSDVLALVVSEALAFDTNAGGAPAALSLSLVRDLLPATHT
jgi:hypothetical protein